MKVNIKQGSVINTYDIKEGVSATSFASSIGGKVVTDNEVSSYLEQRGIEKKNDAVAVDAFNEKRINYESKKINAMHEQNIIDSDGVEIELMKIPANIRPQVAEKIEYDV